MDFQLYLFIPKAKIKIIIREQILQYIKKEIKLKILYNFMQKMDRRRVKIAQENQEC
jgi:hypothetical protein